MAVTLTITRETHKVTRQHSPHGDGKLRETVKIQGAASAADDTGTYTIEAGYGFKPIAFVGGPFTASFSGQVMTLVDEAGIGSGAAYGEVIIVPEKTQ